MSPNLSSGRHYLRGGLPQHISDILSDRYHRLIWRGDILEAETTLRLLGESIEMAVVDLSA